MMDSSSFTSLAALANSHLSKTCIQSDNTENSHGLPRRIPIPSLRPGTLSDTGLAPNRFPNLPLPPFTLSESPIRSVLDEQISNMLKAKEKKRIEEEAKLNEEFKSLKVEEPEVMIDLTQALQEAALFRQQYDAEPRKKEVLSKSLESLFEPKFLQCDTEPEHIRTSAPLLPCITDMSYMLKKKIKRGKCSAFGQVLVSRLRPVAAPYLHTRIKTDIIPFDFKTKSPCDLIKEKLHWKPSMSQRFTFDITTFV